MSKAKLERLLNLTALLIETPRPLTAGDIHERMEGYPEDPVAFRQAFERDKRDLRDMGIPLVMEPIPNTLPAVDGYRIPKDDYYLADPGLDPDELAALHLAASAVQVDGVLDAAHQGLAKLGALAATTEPGLASEPDLGVAALPGRSDLGAIFGAVIARRPVRFVYRDEKRTLDPYRLDFQRGRWYLSGYDHQREAVRIFRLDRVDGDVEVLDGPVFERREDAAAGPVEPWQLGDGEPVVARLAVDASQGPWVADHLGPSAVVETQPDGGLVVEVPVTNPESFRSFALTFLDHAEVLAPDDLRAEMIRWLDDLASTT